MKLTAELSRLLDLTGNVSALGSLYSNFAFMTIGETFDHEETEEGKGKFLDQNAEESYDFLAGLENDTVNLFQVINFSK